MNHHRNSGRWSVDRGQKARLPMRAKPSAFSFRLSTTGVPPRLAHRAAAAAGLAALLLVAGCRQDMQNEPKMVPQRGSDFFADHRGARPQVLDTVARGQLHEDSYFYTGLVQGPNGYRQELNEMPFPGNDGSAEARPGAVQHLLHALPLARGQRLGRDCAARIQTGRQFSRPGAVVAAPLALLLRDDARLRRHAGLLVATCLRKTAGRLRPTSAPCSSARQPRCRMFRQASRSGTSRMLQRKKDCPENTRSRGLCRRRRFRRIRR